MNKPILTSLAALALLAGGAAYAQSSSPPGAMHNRAEWQSRHQEARLAQLKAQLKLTAAQEPAWNTFAGALESMHASRMGKKMKTANAGELVPAPQYFEQRAQYAEEHAQKARELARVVKTFYEQLTPVQRAVLDTHLADSRNRFMKHRYHMKRMDRQGPSAPPPPAEPGSGSGNGR